MEVSDFGAEVDVGDIAAGANAEFCHTLRMSEQEKIGAWRGQFFLVGEIAASHADHNTQRKQVSHPALHRFLPHISVARCRLLYVFMRAVAIRLIARVFASAEPNRLAFGGGILHRSEFGCFV